MKEKIYFDLLNQLDDIQDEEAQIEAIIHIITNLGDLIAYKVGYEKSAQGFYMIADHHAIGIKAKTNL